MTKPKKTDTKTDMMIGARNTPEGKALGMQPWDTTNNELGRKPLRPTRAVRCRSNGHGTTKPKQN